MENKRGSHGLALFTVIIFTAALILPANCPAQDNPEQFKIADVNIAGNFYVDPVKIYAAIHSKPGQFFSAAEAAEDARRISEIDGVEYAYYSTAVADGAVKLTFAIIERNIVRSIDFEGNKKLSDKKLLKELNFTTASYMDRFLVAGGAEAVEEYYKSKGYAFAEVKLDEEKLKTGHVVYNVYEGPRVKIAKVKFDGNKKIRTSELREVVKSKATSFLILTNHLKQADIDKDITALRDAYNSRGYLDTGVQAKVDYAKGNKKATITFIIAEGPRYNVEKILISGNTKFTTEQLVREFKLKPGEFYSNQKSKTDTETIENKYKEQGYIYVKVTHNRTFTGPDTVIAQFDIIEDSQYYLGAVNITGNRDTQDKVIRRVLDESDFTPGNLWNAKIAAGTGEGKLEKDVKRSMYADDVIITPAGDEPNTRDAQVAVTEGKTGSVMFGAGVSSQDGIIGQVIYEQRNFNIADWPKNWQEFFAGKAFKGAGQRLRIALEPGTEVSNYSVSFTDPYWKDKPIEFDLAASKWMRGRESYDEDRLKGFTGFTKRFKNRWYTGLDFRGENVSIDDLDSDVPDEIRDVQGDNLLAGLKLKFGRDMTDDKWNPTSGYNFEMSYEQVAGDHTFGVTEGIYRLYKTLHEDLAKRKTVLETKIYAAAIATGTAPVFEKFYGGGQGSIRGFKYRGVSPRAGADDDPIGSEWIVTASSELVVPLFGQAVSGLLFVDAGMVETGGPRASIGTGIQILIPQWFGPVPMRFELATPLMKDDQDDTRAFSFSVGRLF